jgi:hypothetical protein
VAMRGVLERPAGLTYHPEVLAVSEKAVLLGLLAGLETAPLVTRGVASRRRVRHFSCDARVGHVPAGPAPPGEGLIAGRVPAGCEFWLVGPSGGH